MRINKFCRKLKYSYPHIKAVKEQIEELKVLLFLRKEEFLCADKPLVFPAGELEAKPPHPAGLTEEQAEEAAVRSLGDISELFDGILQKNKYKEKMEFCASAISTIILAFATVAAHRILSVYYAGVVWVDSFLLAGTVGICVGILVPFTLFLSACIQYREKKTLVTYSQKELRAAVIGWVANACICTLINYLTEPNPFWAIFPILGVTDWPLTAIIYNRLFFTRFFEAKQK